MKLKLTHNEFKAIYAMLTLIIGHTGVHPLTDEGLQHTVMLGLRNKFYHLDDIVRKRYNINLTPHEAQAFWLWYNEHEYANGSFEAALLDKTCYDIYLSFDTKILLP